MIVRVQHDLSGIAAWHLSESPVLLEGVTTGAVLNGRVLALSVVTA